MRLHQHRRQVYVPLLKGNIWSKMENKCSTPSLSDKSKWIMRLIVQEDRLLIKPSECHKNEVIIFFSFESIKPPQISLSHFIHYDNCKSTCQISVMIL